MTPFPSNDYGITNLNFSPNDPAAFEFGDQVNFTFDYNLDALDPDIRIFGRPVTNGELSPSYGAHGSQLYDSNTSGSSSGFFTINDTNLESLTVDQVRFQITGSNTSNILDEFYVPTRFVFGEVPYSSVISNVTFDPSSTSNLDYGDRVDFTFDYDVDVLGPDLRIFGRPFTDGDLTPGYGAHGSPLYASGSDGTGSGFFSINSGSDQTIVDQLRFNVLNGDQSELLDEFFIDTNFVFDDIPFSITNITFDPTSTSSLPFSDRVDFTFDYDVDALGPDLRIFARPFTDGALTPNYAAHASPIYDAGSSGEGSGFFRITNATEQVEVDQIRFRVLNSDQSELLSEFFIDTEYFYADQDYAIENITFDVDEDATLDYGDRINFTFDYDVDSLGDDLRIFGRPVTDGSLTPGYGAHGSPLYAAGSDGTASGFFQIGSGTGQTIIDEVRFRVLNGDQSELLGEFFVDTNFKIGEALPDPGTNPVTHDNIVFFNDATGAVGQFVMPAASWSGIGTAGSGWEARGLGHFDNDDTEADILWFNESTGAVGRYDMEGGVNTGWDAIGQAGSGWDVGGAGDFNGDGVDDILWYNDAANSVGQFRMDGAASPSWVGVGATGSAWSLAGIGDLNGDDTDDILWFNQSTGSLGQFRMSDTGQTWAGIAGLGSGYEVAATGDFNGDGTDDVLVFNSATRAVGQFDMDGGTPDWISLGTAGVGWSIEGTGDFNADGNDDILWRHSDGSIGQYQMDGDTYTWDAIGVAGSAWDAVL